MRQGSFDFVLLHFVKEYFAQDDRGLEEGVMETVMKVVVVAGGLVFSFAVAVLIEELLFGQIFRMVFGKRVAAPFGDTKVERR